MMPDDMDPDDPSFKEFFTKDFVELMTPSVTEYNITVEVAVPLEVGQAILDSARSESVSHAQEEAKGFIDDLASVQTFFVDELAATKRVLEIDGYDVKLTIRKGDSPRPRH